MTIQTAIEALFAQANAEEGGPGYHIRASFSDGSVLDAPILEVGPNWARVDELVEDGLFVELTGASLAINWSPGQSYAKGPRFDGVLDMETPSSAPGI